MKLDYTALSQPVTQADIDAYQSTYSDKIFIVPKAVEAAGVVFLIVIVTLVIGLVAMGYGEAVAALIPVVMGAIIAVAYMKANQAKVKRRAKVYKFALANNAQFITNVPNPRYDGAIFNYGDDRSIVDAILLPGNTEIGNHKYVSGSGRSRSEYHWGYVRIKLTRKLPHILLDAKSNNIFGKISNLPENYGKQSLSLEGDFDKYFTLYAPDGYERDALYVLTPDVMAAIVDAGKSNDIEIVDDELFIYGPAIDLGMQSAIEKLLHIADTIGSELRDQTDHYQDDRAPNHMANMVAEPGRRLKKRMHTWQIIAIVLLVIYASIQLVPPVVSFFIYIFS